MCASNVLLLLSVTIVPVFGSGEDDRDMSEFGSFGHGTRFDDLEPGTGRPELDALGPLSTAHAAAGRNPIAARDAPEGPVAGPTEPPKRTSWFSNWFSCCGGSSSDDSAEEATERTDPPEGTSSGSWFGRVKTWVSDINKTRVLKWTAGIAGFGAVLYAGYSYFFGTPVPPEPKYDAPTMATSIVGLGLGMTILGSVVKGCSSSSNKAGTSVQKGESSEIVTKLLQKTPPQPKKPKLTKTVRTGPKKVSKKKTSGNFWTVLCILLGVTVLAVAAVAVMLLTRPSDEDEFDQARDSFQFEELV